MHLRIACVLLLLAPAAAYSQAPDHIEPKAMPAPAASQTKAGRGATAVPDLNAIIANPEELAKGRRLFEAHCVQCHGPKGEGSRGPTLAQPNLPRASDDASLLNIVRRGIPGTEMPGARLKAGEAPYLAAYVRSLGQMAPETVPGDPARGSELFRNKGSCLTCHTLGGEGVAIGPDLTDIGLRRSSAFLRRALTEPGAEVPQSFNAYRAEISLPLNFMFVRVKTKDGQEYAGVRVNESVFNIQLRDLTGRVHSFFKSDLIELHKDRGMSPMPVYAGVFSPTEMDDIVAYLVSLRGRAR